MVSIVQNRYGTVVNTSAPTLAYSANVSSGNFLLVANGWNSTVSVIDSVDDDHSLTYSSMVARVLGPNIALQAHGATAISATTPTITWHLNTTASHHLFITEITGHNSSAVQDGATSTNQTATAQTTMVGGSLNTNHASNLDFGIFRSNGNGTFTSNTSYDIIGTPTTRLCAVQRIVGTTAAYNPSVTVTTGGTTAGWCALHLPIAAADAAGTATVLIDANLTGSGTLTAAVTTIVPIVAAITGAGTLAATMQLIIPITANLPGTGTLSGDARLIIPIGAALAGSGTLTGDVTCIIPIGTALTGAGALTADVFIVGQAIEIAANLTGGGTLSAATELIVPITASISGAGTLAASTANIVPITGSLVGSGALSATTAGIVPITADILSTANLSGDVQMIVPITVSLAANGTLIATLSGTAAEAIMEFWARARGLEFTAQPRPTETTGRGRRYETIARWKR